jgi:Dehydrogenases with different specificities (related to short-chain alcohol dehydrogenases)
MEFKNKNVVVTGASRGIGLGIAKKLASEGANIAVLAKTDTPHPKLPGTIYSAVEEIKEFGTEALAIKTDIRFEDQIENAIQNVVDKFGSIEYFNK